MRTAAGSTLKSRHDIAKWNPEDAATWQPRQAWLTLAITTSSLILGFMVWYLVSVLAPMLQNAQILDKSQAFWLVAMTGLAGGLLRLVWMFLPPIMGTRRMVVWSTIALMVPMLGWAWVLTASVETLQDSFAALMALAFLTGLGGAIFSGYMPSTSYFFPKSKQGLALGLQAGIGNFGVACVQLLTPLFVTVGLFGATINVAAAGAPAPKLVYLQSAPVFILILLAITAVLAYVFLKSVPVKANFKQQFDIFRNQNTWLMTLIYLLTFGCYSGLAGTFALMMNQMLPAVPTIGWLGGVSIAFLGAFIGSFARVLWGPLCDRFGGGVWTLVSCLGIAVSSLVVIVALQGGELQLDVGSVLTAKSDLVFLAGMFSIFFFAGVGNAATFKQMPMIFPPRQAGGVIGWTAAIAAFGPFIFSATMNALSGTSGNFGLKIIPVFVVVFVLAIVCAVIDWWFFARPNAKHKS
ncbi:MAG: MFS transporter [Coriobacteriales bacterium]|jgi:NNP family nitrate/nitrite transporter-like MFS transporter|nr:MFS transporter [Coriobacteriales bacterium]